VAHVSRSSSTDPTVCRVTTQGQHCPQLSHTILCQTNRKTFRKHHSTKSPISFVLKKCLTRINRSRFIAATIKPTNYSRIAVTHCPDDWRLTTPGFPVAHTSRTAIREAFSAQYTFSAMLFARLRHTNSSRHDNELANYVNRTVVQLPENCICGDSALLWGTPGLSTVNSGTGSHMSKILVATSGNMTTRWAAYCIFRIMLSHVHTFGGHVWEHDH